MRHRGPGARRVGRTSASIVVADVLRYSLSSKRFQGCRPYKNSGQFIEISQHAMMGREDDLPSQLELSLPGQEAGWEHLAEAHCKGCAIDKPA